MIRPYADNVLLQFDSAEVSQGGILLVQAPSAKGRHKGTKYGPNKPSGGGVGGEQWRAIVLAVGDGCSEGLQPGDRVLTWYLSGEPLLPEQLERYGFADISADVRLVREGAIEVVLEPT